LEWRRATDFTGLAWGTLELPLITLEVKGAANKYLCLEPSRGHCWSVSSIFWIVHCCIKHLYIFAGVQFAARIWCDYVTMWLHQTYSCHPCPCPWQVIQHCYTSIT